MTGALLVDKPAGVTSHDVVARVRRERGIKRVGHAGTLDPFATGLLIVLLGPATRLQRFLLELPKTYVATARLGWRSTTGDPDGELTETGRLPERLELPTGEVEQTVPLTSAVRVGGERLYKRAHRGESADEVERPTRTVTVHRAELVGHGGARAVFEIECSSGTYIRTLVETLGDAYCERLRRTAIGPHGVPEGEDRELGLTELMSFLPSRELSAEEDELVGHGRPLTAAEGEEGHLALVHDGTLKAIARADRDNLRPEVVLPSRTE